MITSKNEKESTEKLIKRAASVAFHYGFQPLECAATPAKATCSLSTLPQQVEREFAKTMGEYLPTAHVSEPRLFYRIRNGAENRPTLFSLHIFGAPQAIAEAVLIKTAMDILEELSITENEVFLNGIGDRDSVARFSRELTLYLRKHMDILPASAREAMKRDVLLAYADLVRRNHELCDSAPSAMQYLSEPARVHLRSLLECLEHIGITYEFDPYLIGHRDCFNKTLFEIRGAEAGGAIVYARGGRYDELGKRLYKAGLPATGVILEFETRGKSASETYVPRTAKPKVCFIQIGNAAKVRSLVVLEHLRRAKVPMYQTLYHERLGEQLAAAEALGVPYTIIMGHKEALEEAVIVRNMASRAQETVPIANLSAYLQTL